MQSENATHSSQTFGVFRVISTLADRTRSPKGPFYVTTKNKILKNKTIYGFLECLLRGKYAQQLHTSS